MSACLCCENSCTHSNDCRSVQYSLITSTFTINCVIQQRLSKDTKICSPCGRYNVVLHPHAINRTYSLRKK